MNEPGGKGAPSKRRARGGPGNVVGFAREGGVPKVAVTGGSGFLGARFVRALAARGGWDIVVLDLAPAANAPPEVRHRFLDLNLPHADGTVWKMLREEKPDVVVHLAQLRSPSRDPVYAHELNSIGTLHVVGAAGEARIKRLVLASTTLVYGARGDNPGFLTEDHPMRPDAADGFVRDFVEAEQHVRAHVRSRPEARVAVLRFAPLLAAERRDYRLRYMESAVAMTMMGYDPLVQFLHPDDAVDALMKTIDRPDAHGVFNVAPDGVLPLSSVHLLFGTPEVPVPHPFAYTVAEALWLAGIGTAPGVHAHYVRYPCLADNEKARRVLGFAPRWSTLETVLQVARAKRGTGRAVDFDVLDEIARTAAYRYEARVRRGPVPVPPRGPEGGEPVRRPRPAQGTGAPGEVKVATATNGAKGTPVTTVAKVAKVAS